MVFRALVPAVLALACVSGWAQDDAAMNIGNRLELFVDDALVETLKGARLRLHPPVRENIALTFDKPWEGDVSFYVTVMKDDDRYRMYYRCAQHAVEGPVPKHPEWIAYAESPDGITWTKPNLGLYEFQGNKDNSIVWQGLGCHNFTPFKDGNPDCRPEERYKAVGGAPLYGFVSPDGIHWTQMRPEPIITKGDFDSQNLAFWDGLRGRYVEYHRRGRNGVRDIMTATTEDFLNWPDPVYLDWGDSPPQHMYTNAIAPYFRAPHIYLGFPKRFVPARVKVPEHGMPGVSDGVLIATRDGVRFKRWEEAFLRPGTDIENWTERNNHIAFGVVPIDDKTLGLYVAEHYRHPTARITRLSLRTDGFVSVNAGAGGGELVTKPLVFDGSRLVVNYETSAIGALQVEIQRPDGTPVDGFALGDCPEMYGNEIAHEVSWTAGADVSALKGSPVRLRFVLRDADLYSIRFAE